MTSESFYPVKGAISKESFIGTKARDTLEFIKAGHNPWVRLLEQYKESGVETLVIDVEIELPQHPANSILRRERLAIRFRQDDGFQPEVLALREDFPDVPHLNLTYENEARSLCLDEQSYAEQKLRWTPARLLNRIRSWLTQSARGELHTPDQRLEPLLVPSLTPIVLPPALFNTGTDHDETNLEIVYVKDLSGQFTFVTQEPTTNFYRDDKFKTLTLVLRGKPQQHGIIKHQPKTLLELHRFLEGAELDLISVLAKKIRAWMDTTDALKSKLIIVTQLPKTRLEGSNVESVDVWAFMTLKTIQELGICLNILDIYEGVVAPIIGASEPSTQRADEIPIDLLNPVAALTRDSAAILNGLSAASNLNIFCIGAGALGSHVINNLTKAGFGRWTIVDMDHLLPHNIPRHILSADCIGHAKARALAYFVNLPFSNHTVATPIVADFLKPRNESEAISKAISEAEVVLDISASLPVARELARDKRSMARRASLFFNPSGSDSVMLLENKDRTLRLDHLEMQYYRLILENDSLAQHLEDENGPIRYGLSCRDLSSRIPQDMVALHAAIGSRAMKNYLADDAAKILVWKAKENLSVELICTEPSLVFTQTLNNWELVWDKALADKVSYLRSEKLPNETGGTLVGIFDTERQTVYVVDVLPSPPDSNEYPDLYERGMEGLTSAFERVKNRTAGMLEYVGEWHSHPNGCSCQPSEDDKQLYTWISDHMKVDGLPPLMMIAGEENLCWYLNGL